MHALYFVLGYRCGVVSVAAVAVLGEWLAARAAHYPPVAEFETVPDLLVPFDHIHHRNGDPHDNSVNNIILRRAYERADALDIERVLTREECAAIDRMVGL